MGLVLQRKIGQSIVVNDDLIITPVKMKGKQVRLHFEDKNPKKRHQIDRYEEWEKIQEEKKWSKKSEQHSSDKSMTSEQSVTVEED